MTNLPYFKLFIADFESDTAHLSVAEDGTYNRLLRLCWRTPGCTLPDDDKWLRRKLRMSESEFITLVRPIIDEFFEASDDGRIFSPRLLKEWNDARERQERLSKAGQKGGKTKSLKNKEKSSSEAKAYYSHSHSHSYSHSQSHSDSQIEEGRIEGEVLAGEEEKKKATLSVLEGGKS